VNAVTGKTWTGRRLMQILTKPKKRHREAVVPEACSSLRNVRLKFSDEALEAIADLAMERKVGGPAALRMILEDLMLDFDVLSAPPTRRFGSSRSRGRWCSRRKSVLQYWKRPASLPLPLSTANLGFSPATLRGTPEENNAYFKRKNPIQSVCR